MVAPLLQVVLRYEERVEARLSRVEGIAVSDGFPHSAGVSVFTLTTYPLLTRRTSVEGSRTGLLLEVVPSPTHGWPTARLPIQARAPHVSPQGRVHVAHVSPAGTLHIRHGPGRSPFVAYASSTR